MLSLDVFVIHKLQIDNFMIVTSKDMIFLLILVFHLQYPILIALFSLYITAQFLSQTPPPVL